MKSISPKAKNEQKLAQALKENMQKRKKQVKNRKSIGESVNVQGNSQSDKY